MDSAKSGAEKSKEVGVRRKYAVFFVYSRGVVRT
jgi:hypothetical protein